MLSVIEAFAWPISRDTRTMSSPLLISRLAKVWRLSRPRHRHYLASLTMSGGAGGSGRAARKLPIVLECKPPQLPDIVRTATDC